MKLEDITSKEQFIESIHNKSSDYIIHLGTAYTRYTINMYKGKKEEYKNKIKVKSNLTDSTEYVTKSELLDPSIYNFTVAIDKNALSRII